MGLGEMLCRSLQKVHGHRTAQGRSRRGCGMLCVAQGHRITSYGLWHAYKKKKTGLPTGMSHRTACGWSQVCIDSGLAALWPCTFCSDPVLRWIENWLYGRQQIVVLNGQYSDWKWILSGVPQGSVLGPLLFVVYINDIDEQIVSKIVKFADDTKIYHIVQSPRDIENIAVTSPQTSSITSMVQGLANALQYW